MLPASGGASASDDTVPATRHPSALNEFAARSRTEAKTKGTRMSKDEQKTSVIQVSGLTKRAMELAAAKRDQRWLRSVLEKLGTPEAKMVLRQLQKWTPEQWPRS